MLGLPSCRDYVLSRCHTEGKLGRDRSIPLTRTDKNLTPREIEQKAAELAYFLRVPIEVF